VAIFGSGFGFEQGSGYVTITAPFVDSQGNMFTQEFAVPVTSWSEHAIYIVLNLPAGAQPGTYTVTVHRGNGKTVSASFIVGLMINGVCVPGLPKLQLENSTNLSFGCVLLGETSPPMCFTVTNTGTGPLNISDVTLMDPSMLGFQLSSGNQPGTLAPGQSRDICVILEPMHAGTSDASVTVTTNAPGGPVVVPFHGTGASGICGPGLPVLSVNPTYLSFGCIHIGETSSPLCFTVTNTGTGPLNITDVSINDPSRAGFSISSGAEPGTLAPGESRDICVIFVPHDPPGTFDAFVTVTTNAPGGPVVVQFHGTGAHHGL
jgi:uncharacterized membrane protein